MLGRTIGKYRVVEALGRGGMGTVYKAVDETLDREVAIKVVNADLLETDGVRRFRAEAVTLAKLNHPRIAQVYELTRDGDNLLMVMEFVRGETFEKLIARSGAMPVDNAVALAAQVLDALQHAHNSGIVHRDLKPANLMLTPSGEVKVMDFGIARVQGSEHLTNSGYMMGTPAYMAPEQVRGEDVDARTDVYAMGVVLYRMLTGQLPFKADTAVAMIQKQLNDQPTPSRQVRADIPVWLDEVLQRALSKNPADRFQAADALRLGLLQGTHPDQFLPTLPPTPTPILRDQGRASAPETRTAGQISASQTTVTLKKGHVAGVAAVLALLVLAVGALAFFILRGRDSQPTGAPAQTAATTTPAAPAPEAPAPVPATAVPATAVQPTPVQPPPPSPAPPSRPASSPRPAVTASKAPVAQAPGPATQIAESAVAPPAATPPSPAPAARGAAPISFSDVKLVVPDGDKVKEYDVVLTLDEGRLSVVSARMPSISKSMPYQAIASATYSRSRHPRWKEGIGVAIVAGVFSAPIFFMKSTRHWLTLQSKDDYFLLHLDKDNYSSILPAFESRAGITVQRLEGDK